MIALLPYWEGQLMGFQHSYSLDFSKPLCHPHEENKRSNNMTHKTTMYSDFFTQCSMIFHSLGVKFISELTLLPTNTSKIQYSYFKIWNIFLHINLHVDILIHLWHSYVPILLIHATHLWTHTYLCLYLVLWLSNITGAIPDNIPP